MEMWWLFGTLMRYPREIFDGPLASVVGKFFTFAIPIMLVTNVPARVMKQTLDPWLACYTIGVALLMLWVSRRVFRAALHRQQVIRLAV